MSLVLIPQGSVAQVWGLAAPFLDKASRAGAMQSVDQWRADCISGARQLWLIWTGETCNGAGITFLSDTPRGRTCVIDGFGARTGSQWHATLPVVEAWAKSQDCVRVRVYGRVGWTEKLKDYALKGVILDRSL